MSLSLHELLEARDFLEGAQSIVEELEAADRKRDPDGYDYKAWRRLREALDMIDGVFYALTNIQVALTTTAEPVDEPL